MTLIENISEQPIQFQKYHLLPKRKVMISEKELKSIQIQNLLKGGFVKLMEVKQEAKELPPKSKKKKAEKKFDIEKISQQS